MPFPQLHVYFLFTVLISGTIAAMRAQHVHAEVLLLWVGGSLSLSDPHPDNLAYPGPSQCRRPDHESSGPLRLLSSKREEEGGRRRGGADVAQGGWW